jgi:hypothetical protein
MLANRGEREAQMSNQLARHGAASIGLEINALDGSQWKVSSSLDFRWRKSNS